MPARKTQQQFISDARAKHGDKYDYSGAAYETSQSIVEIVCPNHGLFTQKASSHLMYGCKKCGDTVGTKKRSMSRDSFIERSSAIHGGRYDYSRVALQNQHELVTIGCPVHGWFDQAANDHLKGRGCSKCGVDRTMPSRIARRTSNDAFIEKARRVHGDTYRYDLTRYKGAKEKIVITCKDHGDFEQYPFNHLAGNQCPSCAIINRRVSLGEFVQRARIVHGERYDYVEYVGYDVDVGIHCPDHGVFHQSGSDHLDGHGCPFCARERTVKALRIPVDQLQYNLNSKFGDLLQFDPRTYTDMTTELSFTCHRHGDYQSTMTLALLRTHPCNQCAVDARAENTRLTQAEFEHAARDRHGDKYTYGTYTRSSEAIEIVCPYHGSFNQLASNHLSGYGCPSCGYRKRLSQNAWLDMMGVTMREVSLTISNQRFIVDGFDPQTNTIYEYWGDFWHGNPKRYDLDTINTVVGCTFRELYDRTQQKRRTITAAGYQLIEIWECDWEIIRGKKNI